MTHNSHQLRTDEASGENSGERGMVYADDELLPISALQHLVFCERQCALIHVEREWDENQQTAEGRVLHERVDEGYKEYRRGLKQFAGVLARSLIMGLYGRLDVLELIKAEDGPEISGFLGLTGRWQLHPVEFKRGKPKKHDADRVQVCAQAMCLEEMTGTRIPTGSLFYGQTRRREEVEFNASLRETTQRATVRLHQIIDQRLLPEPVFKRHCASCSLQAACQPQHVRGSSTDAYRKALFE